MCKKHRALHATGFPLRRRDLEVAVHGDRNDVEISPFGSPRSAACQRRWAGWFNLTGERPRRGQAPEAATPCRPSMQVLRKDES